jgi:hypothetical protein
MAQIYWQDINIGHNLEKIPMSSMILLWSKVLLPWTIQKNKIYTKYSFRF